LPTPCRIISVANPTAAAGIDPPCTDYRHSKFVRRRRYVQDVLLPQMAGLGDAAIFDAVTDADFTILPGTPAVVTYRDVRLTVDYGSTGNLLSHLMLWRECVAAGRPLLILEDDAELPAGHEVAVAVALDAFGSTVYDGPAVLHLLSAVPWHPTARKEFPDGEPFGLHLIRLRSAGDLSGTAAYAVNPAGAAALLGEAERLPTLPTDGFIDRAFRACVLDVFVPADYRRGFTLYEHFADWQHTHRPA